MNTNLFDSESRRGFLFMGAAGLLTRPLAALAQEGATTAGLPERVKNVNFTDIRGAIEMGCGTMSRDLNRDDHDIPFFASQVWPHAELSWDRNFSEAHVPGRHLNALLSAEGTIGYKVPENVIANDRDAAFFSYSGAFPLPLNRETQSGKPVRFLPHNIREGFHALYALVRYRHSARARELAEKSIDCINRLWSPEKGWDKAEIKRQGVRLIEFKENSPFITGIARAIGPLVKYYRATQYGPALQLALTIKDKAIAEYFNKAGQYDVKHFGTHVHSTTCTMSSLAQLAELMQDAPLMNRVKAFYDNGLKQVSDENGWSIENSGANSNPDRGEGNNIGDILETALILGRWGYAGCYEQAERTLRSILLPCQLRDISFIKNPPNPNHIDGKREVAERHLGAFGFPAPYGHMPVGVQSISFNMDIVGGVVGSLCEAVKHCITSGLSGVRVNLLFDHEAESVSVKSPYTHDVLVIRTKRQCTLSLRLPSWVDRQALHISDSPKKPWFEGEHVFFFDLPANTELKIRFELAKRHAVLRHRTRNIRVRFEGDHVTAMDNFGQPLHYFAGIESPRLKKAIAL